MKLKNIRVGLLAALVFAGMAVYAYVSTGSWSSVAYFSVLAIVLLLLDSGKKPAPQQ